MFGIISKSFLPLCYSTNFMKMLWYKQEKYYCEYMYCLYTGKRKISVENITFYLWKSVQNIKNKSWNYILLYHLVTGPRSAVGNVSGYRCVSDCRSRGREFDPGPVPYFRGDWSWNNFYGHSPPFRWFIQEGLLSVTSESLCTNYWLTACSSLPRKKCG